MCGSKKSQNFLCFFWKKRSENKKKYFFGFFSNFHKRDQGNKKKQVRKMAANNSELTSLINAVRESITSARDPYDIQRKNQAAIQKQAQDSIDQVKGDSLEEIIYAEGRPKGIQTTRNVWKSFRS
jgi:hypothetical protein